MKNNLVLFFSILIMTTHISVAGAAGIDSSTLLVSTQQGLVKGIVIDSVRAWKNIPYAKAPVGDLRFRAPQAPESWTGVRDGSVAGPAAPQTRRLAKEPNGRSEDCLSLNVWSPAADGQKRPVMVWIHGGGFLVGSATTPMYDGASLSRNGDVVVVNINYRLGALGFLYFNDIKGSNTGFDDNLGIRDQVAALQWVKRNIAAFGGDPEAVTIFGESAGAISVLTLMAVPSAKGLFKRAIVESASPKSLWHPKTATDLTLRYLKKLGVTPDDLAKLKSIPVDTFTEAMDALIGELMHEQTTVKILSPTVDGTFITEDPMSAIQSGKAAGIDLMIGTTKDEATLLSLKRIGITPRNAGELAPYLANITPERRQNLIAQYKHFPHRKGVMAMTTDGIFIMPSIKVSELQTKFASTYMYRFDWSSPAMKMVGLRACHGAELPFVFGTLDRKPGKYFAFLSNKKLNWQLSKQIQQSWANFARYGNPDPKGQNGWVKYDSTARTTMIFDKKVVQVVADPRSEQRVAWSGLSIFK
jgi:para-nitrobenzyl esterase